MKATMIKTIPWRQSAYTQILKKNMNKMKKKNKESEKLYNTYLLLLRFKRIISNILACISDKLGIK